MSFTVESLLNNTINKRFNDKIFWYASKVIIKDDAVSIYIDNNNLVTFDNIELNILKISKLISIKQKNKFKMQNVLVSSGSFLFINHKLAVTQRDSITTFDPEFWTTPAGRCDRTIYETGIKETLEEIEISKNQKRILPDIAQCIIPNNNIEYYKTSSIDNKINLKTYNVKLYLDNKLIENCQSWMYYSEDVNTLEFRIPIFAKLDEDKITFTNPEFGTDTGLKDIKELQNLDLVPALKQLIKEIKNETER